MSAIVKTNSEMKPSALMQAMKVQRPRMPDREGGGGEWGWG